MTRRITLYSIFTALGLTLSFLERLVPIELFIPLPGIKLGIANIVTLLALVLFGFKGALLILSARCVLAAALFGSLTSLWFSICGGFLALVVMSLCLKSRWLSYVGVSIAGAAAHNTGQILAAAITMKSFYIFAYLPALLIASVVTGGIIGFVSLLLIDRVKKIVKA